MWSRTEKKKRGAVEIEFYVWLVLTVAITAFVWVAIVKILK